MVSSVASKFGSSGLARSLGYGLAYAAWVLIFHLLTLTLVTYFLMGPGSHFQDISDAYGSLEIPLAGLGAALFVLLLKLLNPANGPSTEEIISRGKLIKRFSPGLLHGAALGLGAVAAFLLSGLYRYLGFFLHPEEALVTLGSAALRVGSLVMLVYAEEFIFRHKLLQAARRRLPDLPAIALTALIFCGVKALQFDLGVMQLTTLFLLSMRLGIKASLNGDFTRGAGYWAGWLIVLHPLLGLPVLGNDYPGLFLVRFESPLGGAPGSDTGDWMARFLTGGAGGPLSSFAMQLMLLFDVAQSIVKNKIGT